MDTLMNAGKAVGFAAAKGKKIKAKGIHSSGSGFETLGGDINSALNTIGNNHDIIWIATMAAPRNSNGYMMGAIIYYVER